MFAVWIWPRNILTRSICAARPTVPTGLHLFQRRHEIRHTNQFHGSAFEFFRDKGLNANDPINKSIGLAKSPYYFKQFGGDIGGPIVRNKLFFFFDYLANASPFPIWFFSASCRPLPPTQNRERLSLTFRPVIIAGSAPKTKTYISAKLNGTPVPVNRNIRKSDFP
jgi:hypothetical protein